VIECKSSGKEVDQNSEYSLLLTNLIKRKLSEEERHNGAWKTPSLIENWNVQMRKYKTHTR